MTRYFPKFDTVWQRVADLVEANARHKKTGVRLIHYAQRKGWDESFLVDGCLHKLELRFDT